MKRYAQYKNSGIEWIGDIPEDWQVKRLKHIAKLVTGGTPPMNEEDNYSDQGLMWVKPDNLLEFNAICNTKSYLSIKGKNLIRKIPARMPLVCCIGDVGKFGFSEEVVATNQQINAVLFGKKIDIRFGLYLVAISEQEWKSSSNTNVVPILNSSRQGLIIYPVPSYEEQKAIADYLDRKTTQIDDLVAKKERMIELLKEERTAIINQAVTRGLDETVEFKDSGIEWLGKIPKDWEVKKLKFNASVRFSNVDKKTKEGEESVKLCNYVDVYYNDFITLKLEFMAATASVEEIRKFQLNVDDVIVTKDSESWDDIAVPAYVAEGEDKLLCGYHLAQIKSDVKVLNGKSLFWMLSGKAFNHQYRVEATGVTRYGLSSYALSNSFTVLPPINEQKKISDYLDKKTKQIHGQVERQKKSIELLKEYCIALISEVVTGKIDVRSET